MKFKIKLKRKIFLKKTTWLVLALFAITMVYIPKLKASADTPPGTIDADVIKILEIAPGNQYALQCTDNVVYQTGTNNVRYKVTHMDMSQFNSMVDDVAGEYDAVVISDDSNSGMQSTYWIQNMYRQYTTSDSQEMTVAKYLYSAGSNPDNDPTKYYYSGKTINGKSIVEYYSGNDITNKRAQKLVDMISKGLPVYFDTTITNTAAIANTNLVSIIGKNSGTILKANSWITANNVANDASSRNVDNKRPKVYGVTGPDSEVRDTNGTVTAKRDLGFAVNVNAEANETLTINLYLDFNADGLYTDDEKVPIQLTGTNAAVKDLQVQGTTASKTYNFSYQLYNSFVGFLNWKVDVVRTKSDGTIGPKTSTVGNVTMKSLTGKKQINVLQIYPNSDTGTYYDALNGGNKSSNTRLDKNLTFMSLLNGIDDYNIKLDEISVSDFQNQYGTTKSLTKDFMNGTNCSGTKGYDMVIVGFADSYNNVDISNSNALADLDKFIESNRSVMFTHDTMSLATMSSTSGIKGSTTFTNHYRDIVGQSVYVDPLRTDGKTTNLPYYDESGNLKAATEIPHDTSLALSNKVSLGQTALAINKDQKPGYLQGTRLWESTLTTKVKAVNNAQIASYPFDLTNFNGNNDGIVNVSLTHTQWYQLNLEDPDLVPWFNLTYDGTAYRNGNVVGQMDNGDSRNFYYTYSKKNITYSGTGHSGVGSSTQEFELFINTIVKADRGSDSPPVVTNMQDDGNNTVIPSGGSISNIERTKDYTFLTRLEDPDNDKVKVNITADGKTDGLTMTTVNADATKNVPVNQGDTVDTNTLIRVTIPQSIYANKTSTDKFTVSVTGTDPFAETDIKTFNVTTNGNSAPLIDNYKSDGMTPIDGSSPQSTSKTEDYTFITVPTDTDADDRNSLSLSVKINDVEINPAQLSIAGDTFTNGKIVTGSKVQVTVPQSYLANLVAGDPTSYITITTTATDTHAVATTKKFKVTADAIKPFVTHGVYSSDASDGTVNYSNDTVFTQGTINGTASPSWYNKGFAGLITKVYSPTSTVKLTLGSGLQITEGKDVQLYRVVSGKQTLVGNMNKVDANNYTLDITQDVGTDTQNGMTFVVKYTARLTKIPSATDPTSFVNILTITNGDGAQIKTAFETKPIESPDLF